jgi:hypothetical protein
MRNCASGNLEIPDSLATLPPRNDLGLSEARPHGLFGSNRFSKPFQQSA